MNIHSYIILVAFFLLYSCQDGNQKSVKNVSNDSIAKYLEYANEDSISLNRRLDFNNRAFALLKYKQNDSLTRSNLIKVANRYFNNQDFVKYKATSQYAIIKSKEAKDTLTLAKSYYYLGDYYETTSINDSAIYFYLKAEKIYRNLDDQSQLGAVYLGMARVKNLAGDYLGSELLLTKALTAIRGLEDNQKLYEAYNLLGYISVEVKDYERALMYFNKALNTNEQFNLDPSLHYLAILKNNIGHTYLLKKEYRKANIEFKIGLKNINLFNDRPDVYAVLLDNVAYSNLKLKNFKSLPNDFYESLNIRDSLNLQSSVIASMNNLSEYYQTTRDTANALIISSKALAKARSQNNSLDLLLTLKQAINVDHKNAAIFSNEYMTIRDSLQHLERQQRDKFARIQFETDEISLQKDQLEEQNRNLLSLFIGTVMIILLLFVIRTQRSKNRELLLKQEQQKVNEDIYNLMLSQQNKIEEGRIREKKKIAQELHDGVLGRLFGARLNLDSLNKIEGADAESKRKNYLSELKNIEQDIREISHDLNREKSALINNFVAIFNNLIEEQGSLYEPKVHCNISQNIPWDHIANSLKINIYRITQEALQNINKYADASTIAISILEIKDSLQLSISDDGNGFDVQKKSRGIGLQNISSRVQQCDGFLKIESSKGKGTKIQVRIPIRLTGDSQSKVKNTKQKSDKKWSKISTS